MNNLKSKIESLLYLSGRPMSVKDLSTKTSASKEEVEEALTALEEELTNRGSGLSIMRIEGEAKMATNSENTDVVGVFVKEEIEGDLTRPALETLTILAYRGPLSKPEIEHIRGVNCSLILRNLMLKGLVVRDVVNGAEKYGTSFELLQMLGISSFKELPQYEEFNKKLNELTNEAPTQYAQ